MNEINIKNVQIEGNVITYEYEISGEWQCAFKNVSSMKIEYGISLNDLPEGVAIVPFLTNILPIAWIYDAKIIVPICDLDFYNSIENFKKGFIDMYPMLDFRGEVCVKELQDNKSQNLSGSALFFSGGVDAHCSLINHIDEKPLLITIWGADVSIQNEEGWEHVKEHLLSTSKNFELNYVVVKSEFRSFINESCLVGKIMKYGKDWWYDIQHGIGIIGHAAPIMHMNGIKTIYIASSLHEDEKGIVTCGSDPSIDNYVKFFDAQVIHDGYELTRQMKIHNITQYKSNNIQLRVCWESEGGTNCCKCEKCYRTIIGIYADKSDPKQYGFPRYDLSKSRRVITKRAKETMNLVSLYIPIQEELRKNYTLNEVDDNLRWFYDINLKDLEKMTLFETLINRMKELFGGE